MRKAPSPSEEGNGALRIVRCPRPESARSSRSLIDAHARAEVAKRIRVALAASVLSQDELADAVNVSQATVSRWTLGKGMPDWKHIRPLAAALGVSPLWLLEPLDDGDGTTEPTVDLEDLVRRVDELAAEIRKAIRRSRASSRALTR